MKTIATLALLALSLNVFASEVVELVGRGQTTEGSYTATTTCWYDAATFQVEADEVKNVKVFSKKAGETLWKTTDFGYSLESDKAVVVVKPANLDFSTSRYNPRPSCPKLQVQLLK